MVRISNIELARLLMADARATYVDMARHLNVSEAAVRKKVRRLEELGIIRGYLADVDPRRLGFGVKALIGVDSRPEAYMATMQKMKAMTETMSLHASSGDHMLISECWFKDSAELGKFTKKLESIAGVTKVCPAIITERVK